jgi:hypothetical protein
MVERFEPGEKNIRLISKKIFVYLTSSIFVTFIRRPRIKPELSTIVDVLTID